MRNRDSAEVTSAIIVYARHGAELMNHKRNVLYAERPSVPVISVLAESLGRPSLSLRPREMRRASTCLCPPSSGGISFCPETFTPFSTVSDASCIGMALFTHFKISLPSKKLKNWKTIFVVAVRTADTIFELQAYFSIPIISLYHVTTSRHQTVSLNRD